jgi:hypothetical protein
LKEPQEPLSAQLVELILTQARAGSDWKECFHDLMLLNGITVDEIEKLL